MRPPAAHINCRCIVVDGFCIPLGGRVFRVGAGQVDDAGYVFRFSDDEHVEPLLDAKRRVVEAGSEWMRLHAPRQWAAFCAARLLDTKDVRIIPEEYAVPWRVK